MTHHVGYLGLHDGDSLLEVFNHARTQAYLTADGCSRVTNVEAECGSLSYDPSDDSLLQFATPSTGPDPAPWWDGVVGSPSSKAYGFWIEEWTGLDQTHVKRPSTTVYPRGSFGGPLGQPGRVMKFNIALFGHDGVALEDLFRWLDGTLALACGESCAGRTMWARTVCADGYAHSYGLMTMAGVKLAEGLEWLAPPIESLGCFVRRASFSLLVEDPCFYLPPTRCLDASAWSTPTICSFTLLQLFGDPCASTSSYTSTQRKECQIPVPRNGAYAPVVTIKNNNGAFYSPPMRVKGLSDPLALGRGNRSLVSLGEILIGGIPPLYEIQIDNARRQVLGRLIGAGSDQWVDASSWLNIAVTDVPDWISNCDDHAAYVIIEPQTITTILGSLTVTVDMVNRYGCSGA